MKPLRAIVAGIEHHLALRPATVQCDECGDQYRAGTKWMKAPERAELAKELRGQGWIVEGDHARHVCPDCVLSSTSCPFGTCRYIASGGTSSCFCPRERQPKDWYGFSS